jgi:hypothetical protein
MDGVREETGGMGGVGGGRVDRGWGVEVDERGFGKIQGSRERLGGETKKSVFRPKNLVVVLLCMFVVPVLALAPLTPRPMCPRPICPPTLRCNCFGPLRTFRSQRWYH